MPESLSQSNLDCTTVDYSSCSKYFLYAAEVLDTSSDFITYTSDSVTDPFFNVP